MMREGSGSIALTSGSGSGSGGPKPCGSGSGSTTLWLWYGSYLRIRTISRRPINYGSTASGSTTLLLTMLLFIVLNKFIGQQHKFFWMNIDFKIQHSKWCHFTTRNIILFNFFKIRKTLTVTVMLSLPIGIVCWHSYRFGFFFMMKYLYKVYVDTGTQGNYLN